MRGWACVAVLAGIAAHVVGGRTAEAAPAIADVRVETAVIRPHKGDGRRWDGVASENVPDRVSKRFELAARDWASKQFVRIGGSASLAGPAGSIVLLAARWLNDATERPDAFGELLVSGRVVA